MIGALRHCGPLSVLVGGFIVVVGAMSLRSLPAALTAVALAAVMLMVLMGSDRIPLWRIVPGIVASVAVMWANWALSTSHSVTSAAVDGLRMAVLVIPAVVLASYLDVFALGEHVVQRLGIPSRPALALVAAMQKVETLGADFTRIRQVRRIRGLGQGRGPVASLRAALATMFALVVQALRQASRMSVAMEVRGFSAPQERGGRRTWGQEAGWSPADTAVVVSMMCVALVPFVVQAID